MLKGLFVGFLFLTLESQASLMEIEKHCLQMYQKKIPKEKIKTVCFCVTSNIYERFNKQQIEDLTLVYSRKRGRYEASKNDHTKALVEFDYFTHTNCQKDPLWRFPKDDIGHPDEMTD
ncbi:hypothetical protein K2X05_03910 [bacterium]|nr:hypothetical protein [bacterium]